MQVIKQEKQEVLVTTEHYNLCDKCNEKIEVDYYDAFNFELVYEVGTKCPEGGDGEEQTMELCQKCSDECIKLLKDNGYRINKNGYSY